MTAPARLGPARLAWLQLAGPSWLPAGLRPAEATLLRLPEPTGLRLAWAARLLGLAHQGARLDGCALDLAAQHRRVAAKIVDEFPFVIFFAAVVDLHRRRFLGAGHASDAAPKLLTA